MNGRIKTLWRGAKTRRAEAETMRGIFQCRPTPYEYIAYAAVFPLLLMSGAMPMTAIFAVPIVLPILYLMFRRFGIYLPFACAVCYGAAALALNYDILTVAWFVFLVVALGGLILSAQVSPYLVCAATAGIFAVAGAIAGVGLVRLVEDKPLGDIAAEYVMTERADPMISWLAARHYERADIPDDIGRTEKTDPNYAEKCAEFLAEYVGRDLGEYVIYYCVQIGAVIGAVGYFVSVLVNRRTASRYDVKTSAAEVAASSLALGGVSVELTPIKDMRVPRAYLWAVAAPALVASIALDIAGGYAALSATVMHLFVTVPSAYAFVTVAVYFASLFRGRRAKVVAHIVSGTVLAAIAVFPMALFICSLIGICDVILNLRFWTDFIMRD